MRDHLGGVPLERIPLYPPPGTATERDVIEIESRSGRICELVDGVLVEKAMGYYESLLAAEIIYLIKQHLRSRDLGIVLGEAGALKILPHQVRIPDVSFLGWERFAGRQLPVEPIPAVAPDLAVEILSEANTEREMDRKLRDYFAAGVRLVWYVDPKTRTARAYTSPAQCAVVAEDAALSGGEVLPGFEIRLGELFARVGPRKRE